MAIEQLLVFSFVFIVILSSEIFSDFDKTVKIRIREAINYMSLRIQILNSGKQYDKHDRYSIIKKI